MEKMSTDSTKQSLLEGQQQESSSMENMSTISEDSSLSECKSDFLEPSFSGSAHSSGLLLNSPASRYESIQSTSALNTTTNHSIGSNNSSSNNSSNHHQHHHTMVHNLSSSTGNAAAVPASAFHSNSFGSNHSAMSINSCSVNPLFSRQTAHSLGDRSGYTSETSLGNVSCASSSSNLALPSVSGISGSLDATGSGLQQLLHQGQSESNCNLHSMSGSCSNLSAVSCGSQRGGRDSLFSPSSPGGESTDTSIYKRIDDENKLLRTQVDTLKCRVKSLLEENKSLRLASVSIQARAEQEEEYISNTLLKRIEVKWRFYMTTIWEICLFFACLN